MEFSEAILIVVIIMLVVMMFKRNSKDNNISQKTWDCVDRDTGNATTVKMRMVQPCAPGCMCPKCRNPEAAALQENAEHFSSVGHRVDENENYVNFESSGSYTDSSQSYKDFITALSIDPQTLKNHAEFTQDRLNGQNQNVTGRTYAIPEAVEGNDIPWTGLRRPQLIPSVAMGNPTQMSDIRTTNYTTKPTFTWNSSPSSAGQ